jgi:chromosome partitioning protein
VTLVREKTNPTLRYRLLVTLFDIRSKIHRLIMEEIYRRFPTALFQTIIQVDTRLRESPAYGLPVTQYAPSTRAALQYRALAEELIALTTPPGDAFAVYRASSWSTQPIGM